MTEKIGVKRLDLEKSEWVMNGNEYYLEPEISVERYRWYEKYSIELAFGADFETVYRNIGTSINLFNDKKDVEAKASLYNLYTSLGNNIQNRTESALKLCSLFILRKGEDPAIFDEKIARDNINDWLKEGYAMRDFFSLAFNLIPGLLNALSSDSLTDSTEEKKAK